MRWRVGLAQFLAIIGVLAVGLGVMKVANGLADRVAVLGSSLALLVATLGVAARRRKAAWIGFALFGWAYFLVLLAVPLLAMLGPPFSSEIPVMWPIFEIEQLASNIHPLPPRPAYPLPFSVTMDPSGIVVQVDGLKAETPLTAGEVNLWESYKAQALPYSAKADSFFHSIRIALAFQGLAFALLGAFAGRVLDDRSADAGGSQRGQSSLSHG